MADPITLTGTAMAAGQTASAASGAGVTVGGAAATGITQADALRNLASIMIKNAVMTVVNQSEIVDEFAAPIYSGLLAATPGIPSGAPNPDPNSAGKLVGPTGDISAVPSSKAPAPSVAPNQPQAKDGKLVPANSEAVNLGESCKALEIKQLIKNNYQAPTIQEQLQTDASKIVVKRSLIDEKVVASDGKKTAICVIEEKVVDRKYLEYGHLSDVISEIRHGNIPTIHQIYLAIIDLTDLATLKVFRPYLIKYKLGDARVQLRQFSADLEKKSLRDNLPVAKPSANTIDRQVEKRAWYKTDHVKELVSHKDVSSERHLDLIAVNVKEVCTHDMSKVDMDQIMTRRKELADFAGAENAVYRIETTFSPDQIASINKSAMVWTQESILTTTSEYTTDQQFHRYWGDLRGFLGEKISTSDKNVSVTERKTFSEYLSASDNVNLENIDTYQDAVSKFASLQKTTSLSTDLQMVAKYIEPSASTQFKEGWITYIPGGSIVNLAAKSDLGVKLSGWDYFWAAVDVATIAVAVATLGASSGATAAGKAGVASGAKAVLKGGAKATVKGGTKIVGKVALKNIGKKAGAKAIASRAGRIGAKNIARATSKHTGKVVLSNVGKKAAAKNTAKIVTKTGFKANASYIKNGFTYFTDKQGRVIKATGKLKNMPGVRSPMNQRIAAQLGKLGDEGGHLIPANYGGPGSLINHVPQTRTVNRSVIKRIENEMGRALRAGKQVEYTVMPHYPNASTLRPDKFTIRYTIDGVQKIRRIANV